ncbi:DUF1254 domain-containing protein [candidate division GN15 bacterium]|nr:DUF1254 domain-containing protein [candidate division GN15 bacterium]
MNKLRNTLFTVFTLLASTAWSQEPTPGYNHKIPEKIMTPDRVETRIGALEFFDGMPLPGTVDKLYDNLLLMRGVDTFLNGIPATSIEGLREGHVELGIETSNHFMIMDELCDSSPLFLTANTDTVYCSGFLHLDKDGPTVVEIPPGCGPGTVNDAYFRFVVDMGIPGPDRGQGGKYLILPPDYEGDLEGPIGGKTATVEGEEYFVVQSSSYVNWVILRGFLVDGKPDASNKMFKEGLKVYPLAKKADPPVMKFTSGSRRSWNTIHANNYEFYEELHTVIDREPVGLLDPQTRGIFASAGIVKGRPFSPTEEQKRILTEAVAIGNATARAIAFRPRLEGAYFYENSGWYTGFVGGDYRWLIEDGKGGRNLDARTFFFYVATVNTPAMVMKMVGKGSQYAMNSTDSKGEYLDGAKNYTLNIPANVPAKDFWSVVIYDPQTRSELQTDQTFPSRNNKRDNLIENQDGSVTLYFGPEAPKGKESNWIQTVPGKGWFALLRLYGPLEPWFDKSWRPGEFEALN